MFSRKVVMIFSLIILIAVNVIALTIASRRQILSPGPGRIAILVIAPFQEVVSRSIRGVRDIWSHYFALVNVSLENVALKNRVSELRRQANHYRELELANARLRTLLNFQESTQNEVIAAEVVGKDPSPWFKAVIIDKGSRHGIEAGTPVVVADGVAGVVTEVASHYAKVLLIIDQNSAVDALIQRTRARGVIQGESAGRCQFKYVLRKQDVALDDTVVTSGLDGIFPKGFRIGRVSGLTRREAGIFQDVTVIPFVNFEKLEEVLVVKVAAPQLPRAGR
ncbi:MAG: rod shape-determining protein MreC [Desulfobacterales bacterium]